MLNVPSQTQRREDRLKKCSHTDQSMQQKEKCRMGPGRSFPQGSRKTKKPIPERRLLSSPHPQKAVLINAINSEFLGNIKSNNYFFFQLYSFTLAEKDTFPCPVPPRHQLSEKMKVQNKSGISESPTTQELLQL